MSFNPAYLTQALTWAIHSLRRHVLRSSLSILGIICGVVAVLVMIAIGEGARREALDQISQLGIHNIYLRDPAATEQAALDTERLPLTVGDGKRIVRQIPLVQELAYGIPVTAKVAGLHQSITPQVMAVSASYAEILKIKPRQGRFIAPQDLLRKNLVCVIGRRLAPMIGTGVQPGDHVRIGQLLYKIIGVVGRSEPIRSKRAMPIAPLDYDDTLFIPFGTQPTPPSARQTQAQLADSRTDAQPVSEIIVRVETPSQIGHATRLIRRLLDTPTHRSTHYQLVVPQELLHQTQRTQRMFNIVLGTIAGISLLVGGIGITNIMLANVSERVREIGIRRAVGANRQHILIQFLGEALALTACGGIVGIGVGIGAVQAVSLYSGWRMSLSPQAIVLPLVMALLTGLLAGVYPARRAAHMDPIMALRQE